jgi:hypothetical protein
MIDSGLQLMLLWTRAQLDTTALPSRLGRYHHSGRTPTGDIRCEVRFHSTAELPALHADVTFIDSENRLIGRMEDMEVTCLRSLNRLSSGPSASKGDAS